MELRFTKHAADNMVLRSVSRADIEALIAEPTETTVKEFEVVYDGIVNGRGLRVVVDRFSSPVWVVTVMPRRR